MFSIIYIYYSHILYFAYTMGFPTKTKPYK